MGYGYFFLMGLREFPTETIKKMKELWAKVAPKDFRNKEDLERAHVIVDSDIVEPFFIGLVSRMKEMATNWEKEGFALEPYFVDQIGQKEYGSSGTYSCGGPETLAYLSPLMNKITSEYPGLSLDLYHCYYDFKEMAIYTFGDGRLVHKKESVAEIENCGKMLVTSYSFRRTYFPENISIYFNKRYQHDFEMNLAPILHPDQRLDPYGPFSVSSSTSFNTGL